MYWSQFIWRTGVAINAAAAFLQQKLDVTYKHISHYSQTWQSYVSMNEPVVAAHVLHVKGMTSL